ncbi:hypothetical protein L1887_30891 [Cichorium endivia]|nr:hypothetical protein L1887_30891 [Cichorium endivia]
MEEKGNNPMLQVKTLQSESKKVFEENQFLKMENSKVKKVSGSSSKHGNDLEEELKRKTKAIAEKRELQQCLCEFLDSKASLSTFTLSLTQHIPVPSQELSNQHPFLTTINYLVSSSLARARRLKNLNDNSSASISEIPLFPRGFGEYTVSLGFGSPSQKLSFIVDTGSSLVWFPCTPQYKCFNCTTPGIEPTKTPPFMPKLSSSAKILGCNDKKCDLVLARKCNSKQNCSYHERYGSGMTSGFLLSETLHFPEGDVMDFAVGCSKLTTGIEEGIVGFGRGHESLPSQMGLKKFSYCLVSYNETVSSELVLFRDSSNSGAGEGDISYTKFRKNPVSPPYNVYYYLNLRKITVGGKRVKIPYRFLVPQSDGNHHINGGTIIDSGTTFTMMDSPIYDPVAKEFENQMSMYQRVIYAESPDILCFDIGGKLPVFPELMFHFKGGAKLSLPMADYFEEVEPSKVCMTILSNGPASGSGPSIIIGNIQQQNIYMEYDLENGRLGFKKKICK